MPDYGREITNIVSTVSLLLGLKGCWNHDAYFDCVDR